MLSPFISKLTVHPQTLSWYLPMFGIGLPEMIVILAIALIVVGPDKLPGLARSLAKGLMEMKKTLEDVKDNLTQEGDVLDSVQKDLRKTAEDLKGKMIDVDPSVWQAPLAENTNEKKEAGLVDLQPVAETTPKEIQPNESVPAAEASNTEPVSTNQPPPEHLSKETHHLQTPEKRPV